MRNGVRSATSDLTVLLSRVRRPPMSSSTSVTRSPSAIEIEGEHREAGEQRREEDGSRMPSAQPAREALGRTASAGLETGSAQRSAPGRVRSP